MNMCSSWLFLRMAFILCQLLAGADASVSKGKAVESPERILDRLYQVSAHRGFGRPQIVRVPGKMVGALYHPGKNEIRIEESLIEVCKRFGPDAGHALAFILAHEWSHALYQRNDLTPVFSFLESRHSMAEREHVADVQGALLAYLAGYRPERVLSRLIDTLYSTYSLPETGSGEYPSPAQRKESAKRAMELINWMVHLFDAANLLALEGEYALAEQAYRYLARRYATPELFNNLGLLHAARAMEYPDPETDVYAYPLELDMNSPFRKVLRARGDLSSEEARQRQEWLDRATAAFRAAIQRSPDYAPARANLICALNLMNRPVEALTYFRDSLPDHCRSAGSVRLAAGIAMALTGNQNAAGTFRRLEQTLELAGFARHNRRVLEGRPVNRLPDVDCPVAEPAAFPDCKPLEMHPLGGQSDCHFGVVASGNQLVYWFYSKGEPLYALIREPSSQGKPPFPKSGKESFSYPNVRWMPGPRGSLLSCSGVWYLVQPDGTLAERIRFHCFQ